MSGFVYFIPGQFNQVLAKDITEAGLAYALDPGHLVTRNSNKGPSGDDAPGVIIADDRRVSSAIIGFYPDKQQWQKIPGSKAWAGYHREHKPLPADLQRGKMLAGHSLELGDGNMWELPVARAASEEGGELRWFKALPTTTIIDDSGNWVEGDCDERYAALWDVATAWWDSMAAAIASAEQQTADEHQGNYAFDFPGVHDGALLTLATNYRIGKAECALLGLLTFELARDIMNVLVDWPTIQEWMKKKLASDSTAADTSSTNDGQQEET